MLLVLCMCTILITLSQALPLTTPENPFYPMLAVSTDTFTSVDQMFPMVTNNIRFLHTIDLNQPYNLLVSALNHVSFRQWICIFGG